MSVRYPTFFLAGVPKAGTTSLYHYLAQHPQVFMSPVKEPNFFSRVSPDHRAWDEYAALFSNARNEIAIGEASVGYFFMPNAAPAIRASLPDARLIFMLRDPVERLFSWYLMNLRRYPGTTFGEWFGGAIKPADASWRGVEGGRYATHLERFCATFPRNQIRVHLYEDYRADAAAMLGDIFQFIGVDRDQPIDFARRHGEALVPRFPLLHRLRNWLFGDTPTTQWLPTWARGALAPLYTRGRQGLSVDPADRRIVIDYFRDEIVRTADLMDRDLSAWLH